MADRARVLALAALVLLVASAGALRWLATGSAGAEQRPLPDALEYAQCAHELSSGRGFQMVLEGERYGPRYPPGTSLLLAPAAGPLGPSGAHLAALGWGTATVALVGALGWLAGGPAAGLIAALMVALSPQLVSASGLAMSESPAGFLVALLLLLACLARWRRAGEPPRPAVLFGAALVLALLALVRLPLIAFGAPLAWVALAGPGGLGVRVGRATLTLAPLMLALGLLFAMQARFYGGPLVTGYHFWAPEIYVQHADWIFSARYLFEPVGDLWPRGHLATYSRALLGLDGELWTLPLAALALAGIVFAWRTKPGCPVRTVLVLAAAISVPALYTFHLFYAWQGVRFLAPAVPLAAALAGLGAAAAGRRLAERGRGAAGAGLIGVVLVAGFVPLTLRLSGEVHARRADPPDRVTSLRHLGRELEADALVIVDAPSMLVREALGPKRELVFTDLGVGNGQLLWIRLFDLRGLDGRRAEAAAFIAHGEPDPSGAAALAAAFAAGRPVRLLRTYWEGEADAGIDWLLNHGMRLEPIAQHGRVELLALHP